MATTRTVDIGKYAMRFRGRMTKFKRGVLLKLFGAVIKDTPVLTGRLRGNWMFGKAILPPPGRTDTKKEELETHQQLVFTEILTKVEHDDQSYYLVNTMPYTNRIEYHGWSHTKAPQGMVRKNITRIAGLLQAEANKNK